MRSARMPPPFIKRDVRIRRLAHRVGDQVADRRLAGAHGGAAAVELGSRVRPITTSSSQESSASNPVDEGCDLRVGLDRGGIDDAEIRPPRDAHLAVALGGLDGEVDRRDIFALRERFRQHGAAVELEHQIVVVAARGSGRRRGSRKAGDRRSAGRALPPRRAARRFRAVSSPAREPGERRAENEVAQGGRHVGHPRSGRRKRRSSRPARRA